MHRCPKLVASLSFFLAPLAISDDGKFDDANLLEFLLHLGLSHGRRVEVAIDFGVVVFGIVQDKNHALDSSIGTFVQLAEGGK